MKHNRPHRRAEVSWGIATAMLCFLVATLLLVACGGPSASDIGKSGQSSAASASIPSTGQNVTYNTDPQSVVMRVFHGGGLSGSLELAPDVSIYGDGTFILGTQSQGQLDTNTLQQLLHTVVDTYGLPTMKRQTFADAQDQNGTFLLLTLNGKTQQFEDGSFGNQPESAQDLDEYHRLDKAVTALNDALKGATHPYKGSQFVLLARRIIIAPQQLTWPLDFSLGQVVAYECGNRDDVFFTDVQSTNSETGCMQYLIPHNAIALTNDQLQSVQNQLPQGDSQGQFYDAATGYNYLVTLRPLLPDELTSKNVAMFGSAQDNYIPIPLLVNAPVPLIPTATPSR